MVQLKTWPTRKSVTSFLAPVEHDTRREDARERLKLFKRVTGKRPVMWGDSIVGFGSYHYRRKSGQQVDWPLTGFSPRKQNLSVYIMPGFATYGEMLARLGKHKTARSCLYINKLADIDMTVLEQLITASVKDMQRLHTTR
jgi:hypothetical protein